MRVRSLSIKNYRSIKELDIDFPESGLIGIVGHNGAGKSSLLESIGWALYGTQAIRGKADGLTTIGAKGKCKVIMEFDHGEDGPYIVERTLKDAKLNMGGKEIAVMTSGVNSKIEKLLNMDYRAFYTSIFTKQGGLSSFTDMTASQRQETVERLLEVSKVKNARINISSEAKALENQLHGKRVAIEKEDEIIDKIAELKQILSQLINTEKELEEIKIKSEENKLQIDKDFKLEQSKMKSFQIKKEKLLTVEGQLKILETELMNTNSNISEIGNKIEQAKKRIDELKNILDDDVSKELNNKQEEADKIAKKIEENSDRLNKMNQENAIEEARIEDKQKHIVQIQKLGPESECPVCLRSLGEHGPKVISDLKKEIENVQNQNQTNQIKEISEKIEKLTEKKRQLEEEIKKLNYRNQEKQKAEVELKTLGLDNLKSEQKRMNTEIKEKNIEIKSQENLVRKAKTELERIGFDEQKYDTIRNNWDKAGDKYTLSIQDLERHRTNVTRVSENLKNKEVNIQQIATIKS